MFQQESLLTEIKKRPGMYLGSKSLSALRHFISGYRIACSKNKLEKDAEFQLPDDFHDWCAYRTHFKESTSGWCHMICSVTDSEGLAFDRFFELLEEYAVRKPKIVARLSGLQKTYTYIHDDNKQVLQYPSSIALITYTDDPGFFAKSETEGQTFSSQGFFPCLDWFERSIGISRDRLTILNEELFLRLVTST